ncbi:MAG: hypothetical protein E7480_08515 [Ruminococcaceae bacterium]|nr:hypothetical protein [Oscillospiraceae bacterium]
MVKKGLILLMIYIILISVPLLFLGKALMLSYFLPLLVVFIIFKKLLSNLKQIYKALYFLIIALISVIPHVICCYYHYYFGFADIPAVIFIMLFSILFNVIPALIISIFYLFIYLKSK